MLNSSVSIIASDYINAISIYHSLKRVSYQGEIIFLNTTGHNLAGCVIKEKCKVIDFYQKDVADLLPLLKSFEADRIKYLFLTNELFHPFLWDNQQLLKKLNVTFFIGNTNPERIINKNNFLQEIDLHTSVPIPCSYSVEAEHFDEIEFPVLVKFASSFSNGKKTPKSKRIDCKDELLQYLNNIDAECFQPTDVILQELLSEKTEHNVSVCGWYDKNNPQLFQTRKLLQHPPKVGNGDVVELDSLHSDLERYTKEICAYFEYEGPFEMEFIKARNSNVYKVIEMNPRFWMQHGLIEEISNHYLVSKYLGIDVNDQFRYKYKYWIYPLYAIYKFFCFNFRYTPYLLSRKTYWPISFGQSVKYLVIRFLKFVCGKK